MCEILQSSPKLCNFVQKTRPPFSHMKHQNRRFNHQSVHYVGVWKYPECISSVSCTFMKAYVIFEPFLVTSDLFRPFFFRGAFWDHLASWGDFVVILDHFLGRSVSLWDAFGIILGSFW